MRLFFGACLSVSEAGAAACAPAAAPFSASPFSASPFSELPSAPSLAGPPAPSSTCIASSCAGASFASCESSSTIGSFELPALSSSAVTSVAGRATVLDAPALVLAPSPALLFTTLGMIRRFLLAASSAPFASPSPFSPALFADAAAAVCGGTAACAGAGAGAAAFAFASASSAAPPGPSSLVLDRATVASGISIASPSSPGANSMMVQ
mmetsp:Transcript_36076/g.84782  ORF Transcript_36076/g.84782 Transcript_36076/m.84782 type:complete len:209 (-) Transcript_36076:1399-2025(-)